MEQAGGRRRAALWTIGKGSRSLLRFTRTNVEYIIAGTTTAKGNNSVHILRADKEENDFKPVGVYATEAEVWSISLVSAEEDAVLVIAATRRKRRSAAEIWSLSLVDAPGTGSLYGSPGSSVDAAVTSIDVKCSIDLEGDAIKITRYGTDGPMYLSVTNSSAAVLTFVENPEPSLTTSVMIDSFQHDPDKSAFVDGGWITDNQFFVANHETISIFDAKTGKLSAVLNPSDIVLKSSRVEEKKQIAPFVSRITSVCAYFDASNLLFIGGQDGSLRAFEIRAAGELSDASEPEKGLWVSLQLPEAKDDDGGWIARMCWEVLKGHSQWVSVLSTMPNGGVLSGDIDGLVRCWTRNGSPSGTFPQHVDTVTCATASTQSFITISYDGRIALNQLPVV